MLKRIVKYQQLKTRYRQGDWAPSLIEQTEKLIRQQPDNRSLELHLNVRHSIAGYDQKAVRDVLNTAAGIDLSAAVELRIAALCVEYGLPIPPRLTESRHSRDLSRFPTLLCNDNFNNSQLNSRPSLTRLADRLIKHTTDLTVHLERCKQARKISIVGNAPTELGKNDGQRIDNSDLVFRFNRAVISPEFSKAYGTRTDYWVVSPSYPLRTDDTKAENIVVSGISPFHKPSLYWQTLAQLINHSTDIRFFSFPSKMWYQLVSRLRAPPSAGLLCLATILPMQSRSLSVELFGFSRGRESEKNHYGDTSKRSSRHNWPAEYRLINELATHAESERSTL